MGTTFKDLINGFISLINIIIPVLAGIAVVLFLWGGVRYIYRSGSSKGHNQDREAMVWGLVALFVLFSMFGILKILQQSFLSSTTVGNDFGDPNPSVFTNPSA